MNNPDLICHYTVKTSRKQFAEGHKECSLNFMFRWWNQKKPPPKRRTIEWVAAALGCRRQMARAPVHPLPIHSDQVPEAHLRTSP